MTLSDEQLLQKALAVRKKAYVPYSGFAVGAVAVGATGRLYEGVNVENASYGLTVCAERVALQSAVVGGERSCSTVLVVADTATPVAPCGACRQVMAELGVARVIMTTVDGKMQERTLDDLLPARFDAGMLAERREG